MTDADADQLGRSHVEQREDVGYDIGERVVLESSTRSVPPELIDEQLWVLWNGERKTPIAPWASGHLWWAEWNSKLSADERPEVPYPEARRWADIPLDELHRTYWIPHDAEPHEQLVPTIILPPEGQVTTVSARLLYVDFDDVRDPETEEVSAEVTDLIDRLDSYTELSSSGTGVHVLVYGELPDGIGAIDGDDLHDIGSVEIYDHGRFFGGTWDHADGTPREINERQNVIDNLISEYSAHRLKSAGQGATSDVRGRGRGSTPEIGARGRSNANTQAKSPYWHVNLDRFASPDAYPKVQERPNEKQGAHPVHGKTTSGEKCQNYNIDTDANRWHCFAHNSGGGPMEMAAIMAAADLDGNGNRNGNGNGNGIPFNCRIIRPGALGNLSDIEFLRVCLYARDELAGFDAEMDPPYRALVTVAECFELPMQDGDRGILGRTTHSYARQIYDDLDAHHDALQ